MRPAQTARMILVLMVVCLLTLPAPAQYSGGSGTAEDPYQIVTAEDLIALGETPDDYDKHFILTADIDLDPNLPGRKVFDRAVIGPDWNTAFNGVFDGNNHIMSHLTIEGASYIGFFGVLGSSANISNLGLVAVDVNGTGDDVGGLAGFNSGYITSCYSTGSVNVNENHDGGGSVGGVGGLVGKNYFASITMSYSTVAVTGNNEAGGLVGFNHGTISNCYSTGSVSGEEGRGSVGGLVGYNHGNIINSYNTGTVTGVRNVGGLVGDNSGSITASYSTGVVTGAGGGLVGRNQQGSITLSFWNMETSGQATSDGGMGLTMPEMQDINTYLSEGWDFVDEVLNGTCDYWQISPGGYPRLRYYAGESPVMPEGLGTAEQPYLIRDTRDLGTVWFKPFAHYHLETSLDLSETTWSMAVVPWFDGTFEGNGYVISGLHIQGGGFLGLFGQTGYGTSISNLGLEAVDVNGAVNNVGGLVGLHYGGAVTTSYSTGTVNGYAAVGGLVGKNFSGSITTSYSTATVTGNGIVGGLVGDNNSGTITTSYSTATVTGTTYWIGGLVGISHNRGSVIACYSTGTVTGNTSVGGLVGILEGSITSSYSTASVNGDSGVGGLLGIRDSGVVTNSYSTGAVTGNEDIGGLVGYSAHYWQEATPGSFWDMETSGQVISVGGTGLTTAEMQMANTFLKAGWDFVGETANGTEDIWWILEGQDYPRLAWQKYSGGTGEPNDPYQIATAADLIALGETPDDYDKHFILTADIDLDPNLPGRKVFDKAVIAPATHPNPVDAHFQRASFMGVFDGKGHEISHLVINGESYLGLFGQLGSDAIVRDVGIVEISVIGSGANIGGLAGSNTHIWSIGRLFKSAPGGHLRRCYSSGVVNGSSCVGGLVGITTGWITDCYSTCAVTGSGAVGGLVGSNSSYWSESYDGAGYIAYCHSTGLVEGDSNVGGLVGDNSGSVYACFWDVQKSGQGTSAGGTGITTAEMQDPNTFITAGWDFYPHDIWVEPEGARYPIFWWQQSPLPELPSFSGGMGEPNDPYLISTPADLDRIGHNPRLMQCHFKLTADLDLAGFPSYVIGNHGDYPFNGVFDGSGKTIRNLTRPLFGIVVGMIRGLRLVDPNCTGSPIGTNSGIIADCRVQGGSVRGGGLVGYNTGSITRSFSTATVSGSSSAGGLVGANSGSISNSYSTGTVIGTGSVGGLVARNSGSVATSYSSGSVSVIGTGPYWSVGGLVGENMGSVTQCYSGTVIDVGQPEYGVGGLAGSNGGRITACYSTGMISGGSDTGGLVGKDVTWRETVVAQSFWDIETSGQATSAGGTGKTTAEMQTAGTFIDAGWDFVDETENGTEDIWWIDEGKDYPRLWWELPEEDVGAPDEN